MFNLGRSLHNINVSINNLRILQNQNMYSNSNKYIDTKRLKEIEQIKRTYNNIKNL